MSCERCQQKQKEIQRLREVVASLEEQLQQLSTSLDAVRSVLQIYRGGGNQPQANNFTKKRN